VYVGHAAVALALKTREPRLPMVPLVLACYGPDWVELVLGAWHGRAAMGQYTHFIPGIIAGAVLAAAVYAALFRRPGTWYICLGWLLHWPADFFTAHKGLLSAQDRVGLDLYHLPPADFALETLLVVACCALYARTFAHAPSQRRWVAAMALGLVALQAVLDFGLSQSRVPWNPSLARRERRPHLTKTLSAGRPVPLRMPLAFSTATFTARRAMAKDRVRGVTTLICLTCGKEKFFSQEVPAAVTCDQCGSTVFRSFATPTEPDEAVIDALEAQARSVAYGDPSPDDTSGDLRDLDAR
jgi:hypothetical protein